MSLRHAKQIIYGALYLFLFGGIILAVYFWSLKPAPSCFDGVQNQGESGIDCGGPCSQVCLPPGLKPLKVVDRVLTFRPDVSRISILGRISNPNPDHAAKSFAYKFSLSNNQNIVVQSFRGSSFAYAGEVKYILLPNVAAPQAAFSHIDLEIQDLEWVPAGELEGPPQISVSSVETATSSKGLVVEGQVLNGDTVQFAKVLVVAIFRGQYGQIAGASQTEVDALSPNESRPFSIIHPAIPNVDITGTKIFTYALRP